MPAPTNTMIAVGPTVSHETEDLSNIIAEIDPSDTPLYSNMTKGRATAILHEFTEQKLVAQNTANKAPEGNDPDAEATLRPVRYGNYCQILEKNIVVSETQSAVDTVGASREFARQKILKAKELRRDLNGVMTLNAARDGTDPRGMAGLPTWISNGSFGATGGFATGGNGTAARTSGTGRELDDITLIDDAMEAAYVDGGQPEVMYMPPVQKRKFSRIPSASLAVNQVNQSEVKDLAFIGSASMYLSDFGLLEVCVDRFLAVNDSLDAVYLIDPRYIEINALPGRSFISRDLGKTGDNQRALLNYEGTLAPTAPEAHAAIFDLNPT